MKAALFSLLAVPALAAPGRITDWSAEAPLDPAPYITIEKTGYSGNGCPQGTVSTLLDDTRTVVTFGFDSFQAAIGPNVDPGQKQKNCQLHLGLKYPSGFQMSILDATYHGYVRLGEGVTGKFISSYYFSQDAAHQAYTSTTLRGPEFADGKTYTKSDSIPTSAVVWSPCGANGILNVNNRIALTSFSANGTGEMSNDDATLKFTQKLRIAWQRCGDDSPPPAPDYSSDYSRTVHDPPYGGYGYDSTYGGSYGGSYDGSHGGSYGYGDSSNYDQGSYTTVVSPGGLGFIDGVSSTATVIRGDDSTAVGETQVDSSVQSQ